MLKGMEKAIDKFTSCEVDTMYSIMSQFYDNTDEEVFRRDFAKKDFCLVLYNEDDKLVGFTTQKIMELEVDGKKLHGLFSGDTIIHKDYWGDLELFRVWAKFWFDYGKRYEEFYWFLICKGYKTYRIMPLFWEQFYPNYRMETPAYEKKIINAYASKLYPDEYNPKTGVIEYKSTKDKLKAGVADIGEHEMNNKDIAFFAQNNPDYVLGNDIACLARIDKAFLKKRVLGHLFG